MSKSSEPQVWRSTRESASWWHDGQAMTANLRLQPLRQGSVDPFVAAVDFLWFVGADVGRTVVMDCDV